MPGLFNLSFLFMLVAIGFLWWSSRVLFMQLAYYKQAYEPFPIRERRELTWNLRKLWGVSVIAVAAFFWASANDELGLAYLAGIAIIATALWARYQSWQEGFITPYQLGLKLG